MHRTHLRSASVAIGLLLWLAATTHWSAMAAEPAEDHRPPNILFILTDDLGWSDTTLYGTTRFYETPNIERLAKRGICFTQAYAHPMCTPSRASIMTGLWPARLGLTEAAGHVERVDLHAVAKTTGSPWQKAACPWGGSRLDTKYPTLAKSLKAAGYATGHFGKWHLGREPYDPLHQGFDVDVPHTYGPAQPGCYYAPWKWPEGVKYDQGRPGEFVDDRMADEAIRFMKAHRQGPFYCNFWMFSPHGGPQGKPSLVEKYTRKLATLPADYPQRNPDTASLIEEMDRVVGRIVNALEEIGNRRPHAHRLQFGQRRLELALRTAEGRGHDEQRSAAERQVGALRGRCAGSPGFRMARPYPSRHP